MPDSPRFDIPELVNNAGNVARVNFLLRFTDAFGAGVRALSRTTLAQPGSPTEGDVYLLPDSGTLTGAAWSTYANGSLAFYVNGAWMEIVVDAAVAGTNLYVVDANEHLVYRGTTHGWVISGFSTATGVAGAGTTQGAATPITARAVEVTTATGSDRALRLPAAVGGEFLMIANQSGQTLLIFPETGEQIDGLAANASASLLNGFRALLIAFPGGQWYSLVGF